MKLLSPVVAGLVIAIQAVELRPHFVAGEELTLEVVRSIEETSLPANGMLVTSLVDVRFTPRDSGWVLEWRSRDSHERGNPLGPNRLISLSARILDGISVRVALDPMGRYPRLTNLDEITPAIKTALDSVLLSESARDRGPGRDFTEQEVRLRMTPGNIVAVAIEAVGMWVDVHGGTIAPGQKLEGRITRTVPRALKPLPGVNTVWLESATPETAVILRTASFDSATLNELVADGLKASGQLPLGWKVGMSEEGRVVFDRSLGLVREVRYDRINTAGEDRRLDRTTIRLIKPPKRTVQ